MSSAPDTPTTAPSPPPSIDAWRVLLRGAGIILALFVICFWAAKGYHRGWSQNEVPVKQVDPITELAYVTYEKRFVPGIEFLGGGIFAGLAIFSVTFFHRRSHPSGSA
ncbi:MAG: hypothetical protein NTU80_12995 [Verrucomicrobia bacterium]|nr:hypothetical protein [Verrucomicrobiota bacterium]